MPEPGALHEPIAAMLNIPAVVRTAAWTMTVEAALRLMGRAFVMDIQLRQINPRLAERLPQLVQLRFKQPSGAGLLRINRNTHPLRTAGEPNINSAQFLRVQLNTQAGTSLLNGDFHLMGNLVHYIHQRAALYRRIFDPQWDYGFTARRVRDRWLFDHNLRFTPLGLHRLSGSPCPERCFGFIFRYNSR